MIEISLSALNNKDLFTLSKRTHELILAAKTPEMGIDLYFNLFDQVFQQYQAAMEKPVLSAGVIAQKDSARDEMWIALRAHVKNYLRHPDTAMSTKAKAVMAELDKYGTSVYSKSYESETAIIQNVSQTLETKFATELVEMNANVWFELLKQAGNDFEDSLRYFNEQKANANEVDAAYKVRPQLEDALRKLFLFLPMQAEVSGDKNLEKLVKQLKVEIGRF